MSDRQTDGLCDNLIHDDFFLPQYDGEDLINSSLSSLNVSASVDCLTVRDPAVFRVAENGKVEVDPSPDPELPYLPLIMALNFRSAYNKVDSFSEIVKELGIEIIIGVETWERQKLPLDKLLSKTGLTVISKCRQKVRNNSLGAAV